MEETPTRFRFSTSQLLWLVSWTGVWIAGWVFIRGWRTGHYDQVFTDFITMTLIWLFLAIPPFAVFGSLVGRKWLGVAFGLLIAVLYLVGIRLTDGL
jgi:hypothetical protein